jgi:hypothetical protein
MRHVKPEAIQAMTGQWLITHEVFCFWIVSVGLLAFLYLAIQEFEHGMATHYIHDNRPLNDEREFLLLPLGI